MNGHVPRARLKRFRGRTQIAVFDSELIGKEISSLMTTVPTLTNDFCSRIHSDGFFNDDGFRSSKPLLMEVLSIFEP